MKEINSFIYFLKNSKISIDLIAKKLEMSALRLQGIILGLENPTCKDMENILIFTKGAVKPMDFLFREEQITEEKIIHNSIQKGVVTRKDLAYELGITISAFSKKVNGLRKFSYLEKQTLLNYIIKKEVNQLESY